MKKLNIESPLSDPDYQSLEAIKMAYQLTNMEIRILMRLVHRCGKDPNRFLDKLHKD